MNQSLQEATSGHTQIMYTVRTRRFPSFSNYSSGRCDKTAHLSHMLLYRSHVSVLHGPQKFLAHGSKYVHALRVSEGSIRECPAIIPVTSDPNHRRSRRFTSGYVLSTRARACTVYIRIYTGMGEDSARGLAGALPRRES